MWRIPNGASMPDMYGKVWESMEERRRYGMCSLVTLHCSSIMVFKAPEPTTLLVFIKISWERTPNPIPCSLSLFMTAVQRMKVIPLPHSANFLYPPLLFVVSEVLNCHNLLKP